MHLCLVLVIVEGTRKQDRGVEKGARSLERSL